MAVDMWGRLYSGRKPSVRKGCDPEKFYNNYVGFNPRADWFDGYRSVIAHRGPPCDQRDTYSFHAPWLSANGNLYCVCHMDSAHLGNAIAILFRRENIYQPSDRPLAVEIRRIMIQELHRRGNV